MTDKKSCASCVFCKDTGQGYSEWTITGSTYTCLGEMNPGFPLDNEDTHSKDEAAILEFAETCPAFREGQRLMGGLYVDDEKQEFADWSKQFAAG